METMESPKEKTMGLTETWNRKRPSKADSIHERSLSVDSDENLCIKSDKQRKTNPKRASQLS